MVSQKFLFLSHSTEFGFEIVNRADDSKISVYASSALEKKNFLNEAKRLQKEYYMENREQLMAEGSI